MTSVDASARLAEGRPAVRAVEEYVAACHRLGYQHRDLTSHPAQVREWYDSEEGLDLRALDADCRAFAVAATAAEDAARMHADLATVLPRAWSGNGAAAAREFAWRSGEAGSTVGSTIRGVADALGVLRDELWRAVDAKVAAVENIDARHLAQRAEWLAAARTVTTGAGDLATASELVDMQVKPFVNDDVASDWVGAMRSAIATIGAAYDAAIARTSTSRAVFDVPGELGPWADFAAPRQPLDRQGGRGPVAATSPVAMSPAAAQASPMPASSPAFAAVEPAALPLTAPQTSAQGLPSLPPFGDLGGGSGPGGGTPSLGGGLSGFGQQLADLIGSLTGAGDGASIEPAVPDDPTAVDDPKDDDPKEDDPKEDDPKEDDPKEDDPKEDDPKEDEESDDPKADEAAGQDGQGDPAGDPEVTPADPEVKAEVEPPPQATPVVPPAVEPAPPVAPPVGEELSATAEPAPCEIAADELPQVGE